MFSKYLSEFKHKYPRKVAFVSIKIKHTMSVFLHRPLNQTSHANQCSTFVYYRCLFFQYYPNIMATNGDNGSLDASGKIVKMEVNVIHSFQTKHLGYDPNRSKNYSGKEVQKT